MGHATQTNTYSGGRKATVNIWQRLETADLASVQADGFFSFLDFPVNLANIGDLIDVSGPDYVARLKLTDKNGAGWITQTLSPTGGTFRAGFNGYPLVYGVSETIVSTNINSTDDGSSIGSYGVDGVFTISQAGRYRATLQGRMYFEDLSVSENHIVSYSPVAGVWRNFAAHEVTAPNVPLCPSNSTIGATTITVVSPFFVTTDLFLGLSDKVHFTLRPGTLPATQALSYKADGTIYLTKVSDV